MRRTIVILALSLLPAAGCSRRIAGETPAANQVIAIRDAIIEDSGPPPIHVARGQILTTYHHDAGRVWVMVESQGARRRQWGWMDAADVLPVRKALRHFDDSLKQNPREAAAYFGRANAERALRQFDRAIADCGRVLEIDPKSTDAYWLRAAAWKAKGDGDKAAADLDQLLRLDPKRIEALRLRGDLSRRQSNYEQAIDDYSQLLKLSPQDLDAYYGRGLARYETGEQRKALEDFNEVLASDPSAAPVFHARGRVLIRLNELDRAGDDFTEALRLHRASGRQWSRMVWSWLRRGEWESALANLTEVRQEYALCASDLAERGISRWYADEPDKAAADLDEAVRIDPGSLWPRLERGRFRLDKRQTAAAMADFDAALKADPRFLRTYRVFRGLCRLHQGDYEAGRNDLEEAFHADAEDRTAENALARFLATCDDARYRDGKRAVELASHACKELHYSSYSCIDTLAAACAEAGDFDEAVRQETKALTLTPPAFKKKETARLALYKEHKPYRESATTEAAATNQ